MLYVTTINSLGAVASGLLFRIHALLVLMGLAFAEFLVFVCVLNRVSWKWEILNLLIVQFGYFAGVLAREPVGSMKGSFFRGLVRRFHS